MCAQGAGHGADGRRRWVSIRRVLLLVLALNLSVAAAKVAYGSLSGSVAMLADGFHSLFDGTSNVVGLAGIWLASRPADRGHPYGHTKYEAFASSGIAVMLLVAAAGIAQSAWRRVAGGPEIRVDAGSFAVMLGTTAVNLAVTTYERRRGRELDSSILIADAAHTRSDIYVSASVIGALVAVRLGYPWMDLVVAGIVVVAILYAAYQVILSASKILVDRARIPEEELERIAREVEGVSGAHHIRTRGLPTEVYADLHLVVDPTMPLECAHAVAEEVERRVRARYPDVVDVLIHVEPR